MNFKKKLLLLFSFFALIIPSPVFGYSDKVILGGNNIGITVNTKEILVVGFYKVGDSYTAKDAGIKVGDKITHIAGEEVNTIQEMITLMNQKMRNETVTVTVLRGNESLDIELKLYQDGNNYKTGLYVKDQITGIGTLTYIDPNTKIYGALGHEITSSSNNQMVSISGGKIFKADITGNKKSTVTTTGEKNAIFHSNSVYGTIVENTKQGIYGTYQETYDTSRLIEVGNPEEITLGPASIYTVLKDNQIEEFSINILKVNPDSPTKNILFEITDSKLMEETNGVIKGMSGSPIVQNHKVIGAVTHAIVSDSNKGYGIFITTMLEEGEN